MTTRSLLALTARLSLPIMLAQVSITVMEYADAAMVGHLGGNATASIGLVASTTWLLGGLCSSAIIGFSVQVSQQIGAGEYAAARRIMKQGIAAGLLFSFALALVSAAVHTLLPGWLGGDPAIQRDASNYFLIYALALPLQQFNSTCAAMLQSSGNTRTPGILETLMCFLNIGYNFIFINLLGLGVAGSAVGTALSELTVAVPMGYFLLMKSPALHIRKGERFAFVQAEIKRATKIALPVAFEQTVMSSAYIMSVKIISPLGSVAVAANSLAVTAEGLCYMPGYGIGAASTALIGQTIGAKRPDLTRRLTWIATGYGMLLMGASGMLMFVLAPLVMQLLSPVPAINALGTAVLRIEIWSEPMFAASIVALGVFRGMGDTLVPSLMNLFSMWAVRIPLSAYLAARYGLKGVWIAMTIELFFRGIIFLIRLYIKTKKGKIHEIKT